MQESKNGHGLWHVSAAAPLRSAAYASRQGYCPPLRCGHRLKSSSGGDGYAAPLIQHRGLREIPKPDVLADGFGYFSQKSPNTLIWTAHVPCGGQTLLVWYHKAPVFDYGASTVWLRLRPGRRSPTFLEAFAGFVENFALYAECE